jgi:hypothetical protein
MWSILMPSFKGERGKRTMSVKKKSLISNRDAVKKALIASQSAELGELNPLKASSLTAEPKKKKLLAYTAFKSVSFKKS